MQVSKESKMTLRQRLDSYLEIVLSILLGTMVLNVLWQVASRYLLNDPSAFTDELARYLLIWVGLLGAAYATGKRMHVSIDLLSSKLSPERLVKHNRVIRVIILFFSICVLIIGGIRLVYITFELGQTSSAMQISLGYVYMALPLSGILICYYSICDIFNID